MEKLTNKKAKGEKMKKYKKYIIDTADRAVSAAARGIAKALPEVEYLNACDYKPENFYAGNSSFADTPENGNWRLGYAQTSLVPGDYLIKQYYIAGYLHFPANVMSGVLDDMKVRAVCLDDLSGRGACVFCVIDCVGISNTDVRKIRAGLKDFASENNIVSINISAIHCHSAIDTQGLWGDLPAILRNNVKAAKHGKPSELISGKNPAFMQSLFEKTQAVIKQAYEDMKDGRLYYSRNDKLNVNRDKRPPDVTDKNLLTLHFEPLDGSTPTAAAFLAAHPVSLGPENTQLSSDYIYYMEQEVNAAGSNFIFFQGAELAVARGDVEIPEDVTENPHYIRYGRALGRYIGSIKASEKVPVKPLLNIRCNEVLVPADGPVFALAGKSGVVNNLILKTGKGKLDFSFVTEIGYVEIGEELAFALVPGELAPEIQLGGGFDESTSYNKEKWNYPPLNDMTRNGRKLTVIGLCNDSIGYIIPDNDFGSMFAPLHYEESVSAGKRAASTLTEAFIKLTDSVK